MIVSRADRRTGATVPAKRRLHIVPLLIAAGAIAVGAGPAVAQSGAPLRLAPIERPATERARPDAPTAPGGAVTSGQTTANGIVVQRLAGVDSEAVGVLLPGQGGLAATVWNGSSRDLVADLLPRVPGTVTSPPLRELLRRLLLTTAPPPLAGNGESGSLTAARVALLVAMGATGDAEALIAAAGRRAPSGDLAWPTFEVRLLAGDLAGGCRLAREQTAAIANDAAGISWQKALIFCQLVTEQTDQAQFGLSLLRERGVADDPLFFAIADALAAGGKPDLGGVDLTRRTTPFDLALLRLAWSAPPAGFLEHAPAGIAAALAHMPDLAEATRIAAAIRAEAAGALSPADLRAMLAALDFTDQELAAALTIADSDAPARAMALLYQAARTQQVPAARAEVMQRLWEVAGQEDMPGTAGRLIAPLLADIPLLSEYTWFAGTASRIALYGGDLPRALGWYEVAAAAAFTDSVAAEVATDLWPVIRLALGDVRRLPAEAPAPPAADTAPPVSVIAGGTQTARSDSVVVTPTVPQLGIIALPWDSTRLDTWLRAVAGRSAGGQPGKAPVRAVRLLALLDAVGDPVSDSAWRFALPTAGAAAPKAAEMGAAVYRLGVERAATAERQGETILLAAALLGGRGTAAVDAASVAAMVRALAAAGYPVEARAAAVEAALAAGL
jgi:hypothetical protein